MSARVLDGIVLAAEIKAEVAQELQRLRAAGIEAGLAVVLIGEDPASAIYVRNKVKACEELGIRSTMLRPNPDLTTEDLLRIIAELNAREDVDGILVQLPLPKQIDTGRVLQAVSPAKDVDGFHPMNVGRLHTGQDCLTPCTPTGVIEILKRGGIAIAGKQAVVIGRSDIVGKPVAAMLLQANATVTICHGKTEDLASHTRRADILVAAVGKAGFIGPDMVKPGAVLIDVGINRVEDAAAVEHFFQAIKTGKALREARLDRDG